MQDPVAGIPQPEQEKSFLVVAATTLVASATFQQLIEGADQHEALAQGFERHLPVTAIADRGTPRASVVSIAARGASPGSPSHRSATFARIDEWLGQVDPMTGRRHPPLTTRTPF
jgi:hypothetical protein